MAGGVALNSVANGKILEQCNLKGFWVQPAPGDAGGSLGCALYHHHSSLDWPRQVNGRTDQMKSALLGPEYSVADMKAALDELGASYEFIGQEEIFETAARLLANGNMVAWFQGRMEFGPRALGARSILADPRSTTVQRDLNLRVKKRESFRPFALLFSKKWRRSGSN